MPRMRTLLKTHLLSGSLLLIATVIVCSLIPRIDQDTRSLCVAESWVANSVLAGSLHDMFYYDPWLQTTPPLFLLLVRATVKMFGASNTTLRVMPLACGFLVGDSPRGACNANVAAHVCPDVYCFAGI